MKACVISLGCKMNEVESESLMRGLEERGFEVTDKPESANLYLINTCAVTAEAERKSRQAIARVKKCNPSAKIIVFGCAAERNAEQFSELANVCLVSGAQKKGEILKRLNGEGILRETETEFCELPAPKRTKTRAFVRIQDGCNRFCSYCVIPYLRGRSRSRSSESVFEEAQKSDAKEIVLTGIDISSYRDGNTDLCALLKRLSSLPARIRLGSLEVGVIDDRFLSQLRETNVVEHFHLCLQSGSNDVLKAMNRKYTREQYLESCEKIYRAFPNAAITTDLIVGFPTETETDFLSSLSMIREARLSRVHCFPYSARPGTASYRLKDLRGEVKRERMLRAMRAAEEAQQAYLRKFLGRELVVLFEEDGGYTENYIRVRADGAREGALCRVRLLKAEKDGAFAEILEEI